MTHQTALVYQHQTPPPRNGIIKPMKPGGYSDSGADIAFALRQKGIPIITPAAHPDAGSDLDWVFPDSRDGLRAAADKGADIIWLNTVLYKGHPIEELIDQGISVIGQIPENADVYDDKLAANRLLKEHGLPIPSSVTLSLQDIEDGAIPDFHFPAIVKPVRGRGSQGVSLVREREELRAVLADMRGSGLYGDTIYLEEFLPGQEITITVMPPGTYTIHGTSISKDSYWSLPAVKRFNHHDEIAPYNGIVAVINNSAVLRDDELRQPQIREVSRQCEYAALLVNAKAPVRIDARAHANGPYFIFDLNMKPNMTGSSRPHRQDQDSLTALAARKIGWSFDDLIINIHGLHWKKEDLSGS